MNHKRAANVNLTIDVQEQLPNSEEILHNEHSSLEQDFLPLLVTHKIT